MGGINPPTYQKPTYQKGTNTMSSNHSTLMQEVEIYGNGLLSDETIERTVDILMECDPVPDSIDGIDIDSVIRRISK